MTKTQYRRANGTVYSILMVLLGYILFSLAMYMVADSAKVSWRTYLQIISAVAALIVSTIFFITKKEEKPVQ